MTWGQYYPLQKQEGPWRGFSTGQGLYGPPGIDVKGSRPQRKKAQDMLRKMVLGRPGQTPGKTVVCQGWAWRGMFTTSAVISEATSVGTRKMATYLGLVSPCVTPLKEP